MDRVEENWPIPRTRYRKLYLNAEERSLQPSPVAGESSGQYDSDRKKSGISFSMKMPEDTQICGYMKLRLWVEAWLMWQLQLDQEAARAFTGPSPELAENDLYQDMQASLS